MTTLYKRATPQQWQLMRMIEGAVRNAAQCHPQYGVDTKFARSIAKRAAGTVSSQWIELLAVKETSPHDKGDKPSDKRAGLTSGNRPTSAQTSKRSGAKSHLHRAGRRARAVTHLARCARLRPLALAHTEISALIRPAKEQSQTDRAEALIDACRIINRIIERLRHAG